MRIRDSRSLIAALVVLAMPVVASSAEQSADEKPAQKADAGWVSLFDGKSLDGWRTNENIEAWSVEDGAIVAGGKRSHLYYSGEVNQGQFKNFEFKCDVLTKPVANSGIYFHTRYQDQGWPNRGYEAQVNNTHRDPRKTGGLYAIQDVNEAPANDDEWFTYHIIVRGKQIVVKINDKTTVDYTEPDDLKRPERQLSQGTFALQAHDPGSKVLFRNLRVKVLP